MSADPRQDKIERIIGLMGRPGARTWFVLIVVALYGGLWLFGFDNVMDRLGWTRQVPPPIEQLRAPSKKRPGRALKLKPGRSSELGRRRL